MALIGFLELSSFQPVLLIFRSWLRGVCRGWMVGL